ncbi:hypothetical protein C8J38_1294 [Rhizobium sp. PP-WC-2G-219]|nr:hypothetical protein C8J38_1294 [Rhizobium sp. PP-WC-2G-219]
MIQSSDLWDNAPEKTPFLSLTTERRLAIFKHQVRYLGKGFESIERFYNPKRRLSTLGYHSSTVFPKKTSLTYVAV